MPTILRRPGVLGVGERRAVAGARLDQHLVPVGEQLADAVGREGDAVLASLVSAGTPTIIGPDG